MVEMLAIHFGGTALATLVLSMPCTLVDSSRAGVLLKRRASDIHKRKFAKNR